jgi:hypothetical protein
MKFKKIIIIINETKFLFTEELIALLFVSFFTNAKKSYPKNRLLVPDSI